MTSSMAIGCALTRTQRGVTITGSFSTSDRTISNEALPEPMTIDALSSIVGTPDERRISPDLLSRGEVIREPRPFPKTAEVHDPSDA